MCRLEKRVKALQGMVFNIQKFCVNDGPGIRTTVFLKGCPLHCVWCHNPESQRIDPEVLFYAEKCVGCRRCQAVCPAGCHSFDEGVHRFDREKCRQCFRCTAVRCDALARTGNPLSTREVLAEVEKDRVFYENSGGGVTLSGGEPLLQIDFATELLKTAKESGLHTAVETCGFCSEQNFARAATYTDLFLFDYKETDPEKHKTFTGADNQVILNNLSYLAQKKKAVILRCPIIPGFNDREEHFAGIAALAEQYDNIDHIEIEPYHPLGEGKNAALGKEVHEIASPEKSEVAQWIDRIKAGTHKLVKQA